VTKKLFVVVAVLGITTFVASCSPPPPPPAPEAAASKPDLAADERAIREADARWLKAAQARDVAGEVAVIATDGVLYREHLQPIVGPAAFQAFTTKSNAESPKRNVTWTTTAIHVAQAGDIAVQTGETHVTGLGAKGDREDRTVFVTVWKKENGEWKVAYDIGSTTMPEPVQKK
jgi:uncharacterized protein (TIGR02246 family)